MPKNNPPLPVNGDLLGLLSGNVPLIDVRAPIEFAEGSFPGSVNLPLMTDEERHLVGICYKEKGHAEAVALGHHLVSGMLKDQRIAAWVAFIKEHPTAHVMCFRGGMRSQISQAWLSEAIGRPVPRVDGGYKALRSEVISTLENPFTTMPAFVIGGHTGAGKTPFLHKLAATTPQAGAIDLEGIANHRGSAFGNQIDPQPPQATFENILAQQLLMQKHLGKKAYYLENESRAIGRVMLPLPLMAHFQELPLLVLTSPLPERTQRTYLEYVKDAKVNYQLAYGDEAGLTRWEEDLRERMLKIKKRLGLERYLEVLGLFEDALRPGNEESHKGWIEMLLSTYYDPMYAYQRSQWEKKIIFEGDSEALLAFIQNQLF